MRPRARHQASCLRRFLIELWHPGRVSDARDLTNPAAVPVRAHEIHGRRTGSALGPDLQTPLIVAAPVQCLWTAFTHDRGLRRRLWRVSGAEAQWQTVYRGGRRQTDP